jgi:hypothetical protein
MLCEVVCVGGMVLEVVFVGDVMEGPSVIAINGDELGVGVTVELTVELNGQTVTDFVIMSGFVFIGFAGCVTPVQGFSVPHAVKLYALSPEMKWGRGDTLVADAYNCVTNLVTDNIL